MLPPLQIWATAQPGCGNGAAPVSASEKVAGLVIGLLVVVSCLIGAWAMTRDRWATACWSIGISCLLGFLALASTWEIC